MKILWASWRLDVITNGTQKTEQQNLEMASVIFLNFLAKMENLSLISSQKYFDKFDLYQ